MVFWPITWLHFLQIKKLAKVKNLHCVETIAEESHASALNKEVEKLGKKVGVMVQVNTSNEEQKAGLEVPEVGFFVHRCTSSYIF